MAYTNIDDPSANFQIATYTGTSGNARQVTNDGNSDLKPDLVWIKGRSNQSHNLLYDSSRGVYKQIYSDITNSEATATNGLQLFTTDGFKVGSYVYANENNHTFVAWQWKANGGTTTSVSASGTGNGCVNACTHQANTTAGFSIITYTGRDDQLNNAQETKLTHGLGVAPSVFICKRRDAADDWFYLGGKQSSVNNGWNNAFLSLNDTDAVNGNHYTSNNEPDATHIFLGNEKVNIASATYIGYAFAEKQGYSKFGSYEGNSNANGPFIYTGFKPAFVMLKPADVAEQWVMHDGTRDPFNKAYHYLFANGDEAEASGGTHHIDLLSNGFKIRTSNANWNASSTVIYMAFAENPFVTSTGIPTTAR